MKKSIYSKESKSLTKWLCSKRKDLALTQREFAILLNVHHSIIGKIETGERRLDVIELVEYCTALQVSPCKAIQSITKQKY